MNNLEELEGECKLNITAELHEFGLKCYEAGAREERERINKLINTKKDLVHEGYHGYAGGTPNPDCKGCQIEQALKDEK